MGSRGETVVKLKMTPYFWRLLGKYCVILSLMSKSRGGKKMSLTSTVTGIVTSHLARHSPWIDREFERIIKEVSLIYASGFSPDYVDAVATCSSAQVPYVVRASTSPKRLAKFLESFRPLLQPCGESSRHARRLAARPKEVRGGGLRAAPRAGGWEEDPRELVSGGDDSLGPGDAGPQPELLKRTLKQLGRLITQEEAAFIIRRVGRGEP